MGKKNMINTVSINTLDGVKDLLFEQERNNDNGRYRSSFMYRGVSDSSFDLTTSLVRNCKTLSKQLEQHLLDNFIKYVRIEEPLIDESIWKAMIIGQHYGLPTRLLDWTHSPLVALHFANTESNLNELTEHDCAVWRIDVRELNSKLPSKYKDALAVKSTFIFSVNLLSSIVNDISDYDDDMQDKSLVTVEPPSLDQRIVNQYSFFTVVPTAITDLEAYLDTNTERTVKYVIDSSLRWDLRDILDQLNMNERMIYPGKEGIAKWLARHYFVRDN